MTGLMEQTITQMRQGSVVDDDSRQHGDGPSAARPNYNDLTVVYTLSKTHTNKQAAHSHDSGRRSTTACGFTPFRSGRLYVLPQYLGF